jgi:MFS transporter, putative metabolite:H+ symporter
MWIQSVSLIYKELDEVFPDLSEAMLSNITTSFNSGCVIGCYVFSIMTDKYGRSFIFKKTIYVTSISALLLIIATSFWAVLVCCFLIGIGVGGDIALPPAVLIESIPPSLRGRAALMNLGYCIGPLISSFSMQMVDLWWVGPLSKWKIFACIMAVVTVITGILRDDMLESPIFLYRNRNSHFHYVIREIAQSNGRSSYDNITLPFLINENISNTDESVGIKQIFTGKYLKITVILSFVGSVFTFALYGLLFFEPSLLKILVPGEQYYIQLSDQGFGICGLFISTYLVDSGLGRKYTFIIGCIVTSVLSVGTVLKPWPAYLVGVIFGGLKFFLLISIGAKSLLISESYTHFIRGKGVGFIYTASRLSSIVSTVSIGLIKQYLGISEIMYTISGAFTLTAFFAFFIEETRLKKLK